MPSVGSFSSYSSSSSPHSSLRTVKGDVVVAGNEYLASFNVNNYIYTFPFTSSSQLPQAYLTYDPLANYTGMQRFEARSDNSTVSIKLNATSSTGLSRQPSLKAPHHVKTEVGWMKGVPVRACLRLLCSKTNNDLSITDNKFVKWIIRALRSSHTHTSISSTIRKS